MTTKKNAASSFADSAKTTLTLLKNWDGGNGDADDYNAEADEALRQADRDVREIRRKNAEEKGENIARAGSSGIDVSSYNDALLYNDLKAARDAFDVRERAREKAGVLRRKASRSRVGATDWALAFSVNLLKNIGG